MLVFILVNLLLLHFATARTVDYDFSIGWVNANPDDRLVRPVIGINGAWPCPAIRVCKGDTLRVAVHNDLGNQSTSIHWHGIHQTGSAQMDGPPGISGCPIPPGQSFTYEFQIDQPGTYWYHSHSSGQLVDGLRGPLIVEDFENPYADEIDDEIVVTLTDWYHEQMPILIPYYLSPEQNADGAEPVPYSALIGESQNVSFLVQPDKTYMVRVINMAGFSQSFFHIDQHNMTIIETDGVYTQKQDVESLYVATAQRYSVLIRTHQGSTDNFAMINALDPTMYDDTPSYLRPNTTGYLVYNPHAPLPEPPVVYDWNIIDDMAIQPYIAQAPYGPVTHRINLSLGFFTVWNENRAGFNNISWLPQKVPALYTALSAPADYLHNPAIYGKYINPYVLNAGEVVEVVIENTDTGAHPLHMHGHQPQIVSRNPTPYASPDGGVNGTGPYPQNPVRRDTWLVAPGGETTIRFVADNPGVWLLHCHMEWHVIAGLTATFIEAPGVLQAQQSQIAPQMQSICKSQGMGIAGNAGGNTVDWLDLSAARTQPGKEDGSMWPDT